MCCRKASQYTLDVVNFLNKSAGIGLQIQTTKTHSNQSLHPCHHPHPGRWESDPSRAFLKSKKEKLLIVEFVLFGKTAVILPCGVVETLD